VARYGGEEFIALLVDTDPVGARLLADRMRARIEELQIEHRGSPVATSLTVSLGVATVIPNPTLRPEDLVDLADRALYASKAGGRNRISTADQLPAVRTASPPLER
jgi:diguanylate cyclase (GGDEF)-like protein